jgi:hypothetical protein
VVGGLGGVVVSQEQQDRRGDGLSGWSSRERRCGLHASYSAFHIFVARVGYGRATTDGLCEDDYSITIPYYIPKLSRVLIREGMDPAYARPRLPFAPSFRWQDGQLHGW